MGDICNLGLNEESDQPMTFRENYKVPLILRSKTMKAYCACYHAFLKYYFGEDDSQRKCYHDITDEMTLGQTLSNACEMDEESDSEDSTEDDDWRSTLNQETNWQAYMEGDRLLEGDSPK